MNFRTLNIRMMLPIIFSQALRITAHLSPTLSRTHVATRPKGIEMSRYTIESQLTISREM